MIETPQLDGRDGTIRPCRRCEQIIYETAGERPDEAGDTALVAVVDGMVYEVVPLLEESDLTDDNET